LFRGGGLQLVTSKRSVCRTRYTSALFEGDGFVTAALYGNGGKFVVSSSCLNCFTFVLLLWLFA